MDEATGKVITMIANDVVWSTGQRNPGLCGGRESALSDFLVNLAWRWRRDYGGRLMLWVSLWQYANDHSKRMRVYINGEDQLTVAGASAEQILWLLSGWSDGITIESAPEGARAELESASAAAMPKAA